MKSQANLNTVPNLLPPHPSTVVRDPEEKQHSGTGRVCRSCGRSIYEHKQKIFGRWVCNLALLSNGSWVHEDRIKDVIGSEDKNGNKIKLVARLNES